MTLQSVGHRSRDTSPLTRVRWPPPKGVNILEKTNLATNKPTHLTSGCHPNRAEGRLASRKATKTEHTVDYG